MLKHPFRLLLKNNTKTNQTVQTFLNLFIVIHIDVSFNIKPTKMLSVFGGRGLTAWSTLTLGCKFLFSLWHSKTNKNVQIFSTMLIMIHKESSFNAKPTKILHGDFGDRSLSAWSTFTHGCKHSSSSSGLCYEHTENVANFTRKRNILCNWGFAKFGTKPTLSS